MEHWPTRRIVVLTLTVGAALYLVYYVPGAIAHFVGRIWDVVIILIAATALAVLLAPPVNALARPRLPLQQRTRRAIAALAVYAALVWAAWVMASYTSAQLIVEGQHIAQIGRDWLAESPTRLQGWLASHAEELPPGLVSSATGMLTAWTRSLLEYQFDFAKGALLRGWYLVELFIAPVLAFYFLVDGGTLRASALEFVPGRFRGLASSALDDVARMLQSFVRAQALICLLYGLVVGVSLWLLGVRMYLSLAVIAALFRLAPVVGPWVAGVLCVGVPFLQEGSHTGLIVLALYALLVVVDGKLLTPILLAGGALLHPVTAILSLLLGFEFLGVLGLLVAVPAAGVIRIVILYYRRFAEELQADPGPPSQTGADTA
jgi:predicted PurR-regulated permease PerM